MHSAHSISFGEQTKVLNNRAKFQEVPGVAPAKIKQNKAQYMLGLAMTFVQEGKARLMVIYD